MKDLIKDLEISTIKFSVISPRMIQKNKINVQWKNLNHNQF